MVIKTINCKIPPIIQLVGRGSKVIRSEINHETIFGKAIRLETSNSLFGFNVCFQRLRSGKRC